MRGFFAIVKREFLAYFFSPLAYVVLTVFLVVNGIVFYDVLKALSGPDVGRNASMSLFFDNIFFWIVVLFASVLISMRLISEERKSGSIEALLTAPVGEGTVVAAKFAGAWAFYLFLWLPTAAYPILLARHGRVDVGPVLGGYLGVALIGAMFVAAGTFGSALVKNQIAAAIIGFLLVMLFLLLAVTQSFINDPATREALSYLNVLEHQDDFSRGIVDTRRLVFALSTVVFFLFVSAKALEANKGK